ncbi:MAG: Ig-like domain-containing protein [Bacteroidota bacterium]|nr:Ig-like domain-containing protein [Bacteroidota bacterium]
MNRKYFPSRFSIGTLFVIILITFSCANPVAPIGGPKDTTPPKVVETSPKTYSVNFTEKEFAITFDEFIETKSLSQKLLVSPPLNEKPETKLKGHSLIVEFTDTLKENTTYNFNFGDAIVDLHEGNPIENLNYTFSTGDVLDSLKITGQVLHAANMKAAEGILVMLYRSFEDSIPYKERPYYIASTDKNGYFTLPHLRSESYKIFAIKDANSNLLFDIPSEKIAFSDTLIFPKEISIIKADTIITNDTIDIEADSLHVIKKDSVFLNKESITLFLFTEKDTLLRINTNQLFENKYFTASFSQNVPELQFNALKPVMDSTWKIEEWNTHHDSVTVWLKNFTTDSLVVEVINCDTIIDTLTFTYFEKEEPKRRKKEKEEEKAERITLKAELTDKAQLLEQPLRIICNTPIEDIFIDSLTLQTPHDTIKTAFKKTGIRNFEVDYKWEEYATYSVIIPDSSITDIYGLTQDSVTIIFNTKGYDSYGTMIITITLEDVDSPQIIQILNSDEKEIIYENTIDKTTTLTVPFMLPKKYKLRAISDDNRNGKWDSGIYSLHLQPEAITYLPNMVEILGNWEIEIDWKIKP